MKDGSIFKSVFSLFLMICISSLFSQENILLNRLNNYKYIVVKEENSVNDYKDAVYNKVIEMLKNFQFPSPSDNSILYSNSFDQNQILTFVYSLQNPSNTSGEISFTFKFINNNYETIHTNKVKDKYQLLNEKNYLKTVSKCFSSLDGYKYSYAAPINETSKSTSAIAANDKNNKKRNQGESDEMSELHAADISFTNPGNYYALVIGCSDYNDPAIPDLDSLPVKDAIRFANVLTTYYTFDKENVKILTNPTRRQIVIELDELSKKTKPNDNVLIFYAGHGHYEDENGIGYWFPKDAEINNSSNWLYNDQLVASIKKIKSLHTLLVSDACFSGSIFKTRSVDISDASSVIKKKYQLPSRKAITSGTLKTVPNVSVFLKYLLEKLKNNKEKYFSASQLYQSIEEPVGNNNTSLPQFGVIQNVGDEGGDFIFIRREPK